METISKKKYPELNRVYSHYKGGTYVPLFLAKHTNSDEDLVIYKSREYGTIYARPLLEWFEEVNYMKDGIVEPLVHNRFSLYNGY